MSKVKSFCLFFTSYFPLWVSILFIDIKSIIENSNYVTTEWISVILIAVMLIISFCVLIGMFSKTQRDSQTLQKLVLSEVQKQKSVTVEFVLAFIVPLIAFDFTRWYGALLFAFFFFLLSFLCMKHSFISVNIVLEIANYRYFTCKLIDNGKTVERIVISKESLPSMINNKIRLKRINNEYAIHIK